MYYPVWSQSGDFTLSFEWEPIVFALNDGSQSIPALFTPRSYGATFEEATYTVEGTYTFGDGTEMRALLLFTNGSLKQIYGFTGDTEAAAPREITPQSGDTFTLLDKWMDLDAQGNVTQVVSVAGQSITFSDQPVRMDELDAAVGRYIVGFWVEDLDGNRKEIYTQIEVR